ncbi:type I-MYXAN CRISPR-associated protein Cas6/Cmx6 [Candidatus Bipolaricaulota bacterium]|nr:type I-MYXAN CRISPR-associated protein Cas6/Cmx6 [Candidatus Bipolaricaulota bacterium]
MPSIDLSFKLQGGPIPVDHGYHVYATISRIVPAIHGDDQIGVHPIFGRLLGNRMLVLTESSRLTLRLPVDRIADVLSLAGKSLVLGDACLVVGIPNSRVLVPAAALESRLVVIKGFMEPGPFLDAVRRQLVALKIGGEPSLLPTGNAVAENATRGAGTKSPWLRRTLRIRDKEIVGFALRVERLTAEESILLQEKGIGGRRRFGCGIFVPVRG